MPLDLYEDDDFLTGRVIPGMPAPRYIDYEIKVKPLPLKDVTSPREYYWSLYFRGQRVNGGISPSRQDAYERAGRYKFDHHRQVWLATHVYDEESGRWEHYSNVVM